MNDLNNPIPRLEEALGHLGAEHAPPAGWEARVLAAIAQAGIDRAPQPDATPPLRVLQRPPMVGVAGTAAHEPVSPPAVPAEDHVITRTDRAAPPPHRRRPWLAAPAVDALSMMAAISLLVLVFRTPEPSTPTPATPAARNVELAVTFESVGPLVRGTSPHLGDIVHASVTGGDRYRALWVYRNDELIVACPGAPTCRSSDDTTIADVKLLATGSYIFLSVTSSSPLPAPEGSYDSGRVAASNAGARVQLQQLDVR